jgi:hypothetical protein
MGFDLAATSNRRGHSFCFGARDEQSSRPFFLFRGPRRAIVAGILFVLKPGVEAPLSSVAISFPVSRASLAKFFRARRRTTEMA